MSTTSVSAHPNVEPPAITHSFATSSSASEAVRPDRIALARQRLASGFYDDEAVAALAMGRLMADLASTTGP